MGFISQLITEGPHIVYMSSQCSTHAFLKPFARLRSMRRDFADGVLLLVSDSRLTIRCVFKWVCLKIGYTPNYSHLVGIMISKTIGFFGVHNIFRQTQMHNLEDIWRYGGTAWPSKWGSNYFLSRCLHRCLQSSGCPLMVRSRFLRPEALYNVGGPILKWLVVWNMNFIAPSYREDSSQLTFTPSFSRGVGVPTPKQWAYHLEMRNPTTDFWWWGWLRWVVKWGIEVGMGQNLSPMTHIFLYVWYEVY